MYYVPVVSVSFYPVQPGGSGSSPVSGRQGVFPPHRRTNERNVVTFKCAGCGKRFDVSRVSPISLTRSLGLVCGEICKRKVDGDIAPHADEVFDGTNGEDTQALSCVDVKPKPEAERRASRRFSALR